MGVAGWWAESFATLDSVATGLSFGGMAVTVGEPIVTFGPVPTGLSFGGMGVAPGPVDVAFGSAATGVSFGDMVVDTSTTVAFDSVATGVVFGDMTVARTAVKPTVVGANAANAANVSIPAHQVGDLIVIFAYNSQQFTLPSKPSAAGTVPAWVDIDANTGANVNSSRTAYFVATATNHTTGTWTGASSMIAVVLRGQHSSPIGGHAESGSSGTSIVAPAVTMTNTTGTSVLLHFHGGKLAPTTWDAAPAGYTRQAQVSFTSGTGAVCNTKDDTTTDGSVSQGTQGNTGYRGATVEILAAAI